MISKTIGFAASTLLMAQDCQALEWSDITTAAKSVDWAQLSMDLLGTNLLENEFLGSNRHTVMQKTRQDKRRIPTLNHEQRKRANDAHHSLMAQRERLGLPVVGQGPNVQQQYEQLNSGFGFLLNLLTGMAYNGDATNSQCYLAAETMIISLDTSTDVFKKIWIPAYLAEAQIQIQDLIAILAAVNIDCSLQQVILNVSQLASSEGISTVSARVAGALPFEMKACQQAYQYPEFFTTQQKGYRYGKCLSILLDHTI